MYLTTKCNVFYLKILNILTINFNNQEINNLRTKFSVYIFHTFYFRKQKMVVAFYIRTFKTLQLKNQWFLKTIFKKLSY